MKLYIDVIKTVKQALFPKEWDWSVTSLCSDMYLLRQGKSGFKVFEGTKKQCEEMKREAIKNSAENGALSHKKLQQLFNDLLQTNRPNQNSDVISEPVASEHIVNAAEFFKMIGATCYKIF